MNFYFILGHDPHPGAVFDPDGAGPLPEVVEVALARQYMEKAQEVLSNLGHPVFVMAKNSSIARREEALALSQAQHDPPGLIVEFHVNSAEQPGSYGAVFSDARSSRGAEAAHLIADSLHRAMIIPVKSVTSIPQNKLSGRAWTCINFAWEAPATVSAILLEPFFINQVNHAAFREIAGLTLIGTAIAEGLHAFARLRGNS